MTIEYEVKRISSEVNSLQKDMAQIGVLVNRLDVTIEKLTEVASSVSTLLAVQETRVSAQEKSSDKLQNLIEQRRSETDTSVRELYDTISKVEEKMEDNNKDILDELRSLKTANQENMDKLNKKISSIEKWIWTIVGGTIVISFFLSKLDVASLF